MKGNDMSNPNGIKKILAARAAIKAAEAALSEAIAEELPVGTDISYEHDSNEIIATVVYCPDRLRLLSSIKVCGQTGREYWIDQSCITGAWRD